MRLINETVDHYRDEFGSVKGWKGPEVVYGDWLRYKSLTVPGVSANFREENPGKTVYEVTMGMSDLVNVTLDSELTKEIVDAILPGATKALRPLAEELQWWDDRTNLAGAVITKSDMLGSLMDTSESVMKKLVSSAKRAVKTLS